MDEKKYLKMIVTLVEKTKAGKIPWKKTGSSDAFVTPINKYYSISVTQSEWDDNTSYHIKLQDREGDLIESISSYDLNLWNANQPEPLFKESGREIIEKLFNMARRKALGVDQAVESILEQLESGEIADPDEIPF